MEIVVVNGKDSCDLFIDSFSEEGQEFLKRIGVTFPEAGKERREYIFDLEIRHRIEKRLRTDPRVIDYVKEQCGIGSAKWGNRHYIVEIPDDVDDWVIESMNGSEWVSEPHRRWVSFKTPHKSSKDVDDYELCV